MREQAMSRRTVLEKSGCALIAAAVFRNFARASAHRIFNAELRLSLLAFC
jgi:hypothetical protein